MIDRFFPMTRQGFFCMAAGVFLLMQSCADTVTISGTLSGLEGSSIQLAKLNLVNNETIYVDATTLKQGQFSFEAPREAPYLHTLIVADSLKINFFLEDQDVFIEGQYQDSLQLTNIRSSVEDQLFRSYSLDALFERKAGMDIMLKHPDRVFSAFVAFYQFQLYNIHLDSMQQIMQNFSKPVQQSIYYSELKELYETLKRVAIGQQAPLFEAPDPKGALHRLEDFRGKYVLLDFWASWCAPCRKENPHLVELYRQSSRDSFEIIGLSVDHKKDKWLAAIAEDGLEWTNLSHTKGWDALSNQYGVKAVPQNFLLDPTGVIIDKNITVADLKKRFMIP